VVFRTPSRPGRGYRPRRSSKPPGPHSTPGPLSNCSFPCRIDRLQRFQVSPHCILHVEDDPNDVCLLQRAFHKVGITNPVHVAPDGKAAIDFLAGSGRYADRRKYPMPCLVLLDLHLPTVPGLAVLEWIRQQPALRKLVVVVHSSLAHPTDVARAYGLGANCFLQKPSDFRQAIDMAQLIKSWWLNRSLFKSPDGPHLRPVFCLLPAAPASWRSGPAVGH
jgi:CheY-like chemotaxis protein